MRANAASTTVKKDGEVAIFLFGGREKSDINCCTDAMFYYPNRSVHKFVPAAPNTLVNSTGISLHRMVTVGKYVYSYGGVGVETVKANNRLYRYDIDNDEWELYDSEGPNMHSHSLSASLDGKKLYIFGGRASSDATANPSDRLYIFDIQTKEWTMLTSGWGKLWPSARDSHHSVMYRAANGDEIMAIIGGEGVNSKCVNDMFIGFNTRTQIWNYLPFPEDIRCLIDGAALALPAARTGKYSKRSPTFVVFGGDSADARDWNHAAFVYNDYDGSWTTFETDIAEPNPIGFRMFGYGLTTFEVTDSVVVHTVSGCFSPNMLPFCNVDNQVWEMKLKL